MGEEASITIHRSCDKPLDSEWVELMIMAKNTGITVEQIRDYLANKRLIREKL